jgi:NAD(P)-dependent dehydrogenase (short-subunit alcohol dehydrogenase family)
MNIDQFRLDERVAVVTGASRGLGLLAAGALADAGAAVALIGRDRARLDGAVGELTGSGKRAIAVVADVTDEAALDAAAREIEGTLGAVHILINNAGVVAGHTLLETTAEEWRAVIDTNLNGAFATVRAFAPAMIRARGGAIINIGSVMSGRGAAYRTAYCASKGGLASLSRALAFELGPHGITVNTLCPGVIRTELNREAMLTQADAYQRILIRTPLGRFGEPGDLAGALVFLAAPAAAFITGQELYVDGGYTAG